MVSNLVCQIFSQRGLSVLGLCSPDVEMGVDHGSSCIPSGSATAPGLQREIISKIEITRVAFLVHGKITNWTDASIF